MLLPYAPLSGHATLPCRAPAPSGQFGDDKIRWPACRGYEPSGMLAGIARNSRQAEETHGLLENTRDHSPDLPQRRVPAIVHGALTENAPGSRLGEYQRRVPALGVSSKLSRRSTAADEVGLLRRLPGRHHSSVPEPSPSKPIVRKAPSFRSFRTEAQSPRGGLCNEVSQNPRSRCGTSSAMRAKDARSTHVGSA